MHTTGFKRIISAMLAIMLVVSAAALPVTAGNFDASGSLDVKVQLLPENGNTGKVKPGEKVTARVSVSTSFNTYSGALLLYYDNDFFGPDFAEGQVLTTSDEDVTATATFANSDLSGVSAIFVQLITQVEHGVKYSADNWLFEVPLKVLESTKDNKTTNKTGALYYAMGSIASSANDIDCKTNLPYVDATNPLLSVNMWNWSSAPVESETHDTVTVLNTITFASGAERATVNNMATYDYTGVIGETVIAPEETEYIGHILTGWTNGEDAFAKGDNGFTHDMPYESGVIYTAQWDKKVIKVTYVVDGKTVNETTAEYGDEIYLGSLYGSTPRQEVKRWYTDPEMNTLAGDGMVAGTEDITLYGRLEDKDKTSAVFYKYERGTENNEVLLTGQYLFGDPIVFPAENPSKTGYRFISWDNPATVMGDSDLYFYPQFELDSFNAIYKLNKDDTEPYETIAITYGNPIDVPADPDSEDGVFVKWVDSDGKTPDSYGSMPANDITFTAVWESKDITVTYYIVEEGAQPKVVNKATYEFGEDVYLGTEYGETAGKKVEAWYTDPALTGDAVTAIVAGSQGYKADFDLYGKYTAKSFKATFVNADGSTFEEFTVKSGENIPVPAQNPTYNDWTFISWSPEVGVMGTEDIIFNAVYDSDSTYKASFYDQDDTLIEEIDIYYGYVIDTPEAPVLTGKIFKEWADEEGKTPADYGTMPAKDLSFKASYVTAKYDPREKDEVQDPDPFTEYGYGITFNATEGEFADGSKTMQLGGTYGEIVNVPSGSEKPTRAGYVLRGWSATEGGSVIDPWAETVPDLTEVDVTYYAVWSEGTYNVTFSAIGKDASGNTVSGWFVTDSGNVTTITKQFGLGETIVYPDNPQGPTGYHFEAWETVQASMPGQDITINDAIYAVNENNIFYYLRKGDTDIYDEMNNVGYGDNVADYIAQEPDDIDIYGYLFKGWVDETGSSINTYLTMPDRDLTFYANLVAKKFDPADSGTDEDTIYGMGVIFDANIANASYDTIAVKAEFGKPITPPASPTCEGFRFLGWAGTMDAENAIIPFNEVLDKDLELEDEPVVFYGVWQDNSAAPVVKLIPTVGSTAMIERSKGGVKVVETYNQLTAKQLCYGVSIENVFAPFSDVYGDYETADNFESWFVYGLKVGMTVAEMSSFVEVTGEGRFEVLNLKGEVITSGKVGTGYIVKVYDNLGTFVEQFRVVIFGDEDGKANVNTTDIANLRNEFTTRAWSVKDDPNKFVAYKFRAMDSDQKGNINTTDAANFRAALFQTVQGDGKIFVLNQVTGRTEKVEP